MASHRTRSKGFTLVEVAMAVLIMAIIAGAMIPRLTASEEDTKDAVLMRNLQMLRKQIQYFKAQHRGKPPGWNGTPIYIHLSTYTKASGQFSAFKNANYPYGPYFSGSNLPYNPFSDGVGYKNVTNPSTQVPDNELQENGSNVGWFYNPATGDISANAEGTTADGTPRISL
ncbi:MAG: type II secretion system GspH family protein [Pirellulales bacterium]|nr:type II secretion system GspH family protein [Pirellulales bacterium]